MRKPRPLVLAAMFTLGAIAGCHKAADDAAAEKTEAKKLGDSGFVVDAPVSWTVKSEMAGFFDVKPATGHGGVQLMTSTGGGPTTLDDAVTAAGCKDPSKVVKEQTAAGALFVQCEREIGSYNGKPIIGTSIQSQLTLDGKSILCHLDTDKKPELAASICKSLRKG